MIEGLEKNVGLLQVENGQLIEQSSPVSFAFSMRTFLWFLDQLKVQHLETKLNEMEIEIKEKEKLIEDNRQKENQSSDQLKEQVKEEHVDEWR